MKIPPITGVMLAAIPGRMAADNEEQVEGYTNLRMAFDYDYHRSPIERLLERFEEAADEVAAELNVVSALRGVWMEQVGAQTVMVTAQPAVGEGTGVQAVAGYTATVDIEGLPASHDGLRQWATVVCDAVGRVLESAPLAAVGIAQVAA